MTCVRYERAGKGMGLAIRLISYTIYGHLYWHGIIASLYFTVAYGVTIAAHCFMLLPAAVAEVHVPRLFRSALVDILFEYAHLAAFTV